jgi:hypothetical protein
MAVARASLEEIQDAAGHKTIAMSAEYAHLSAEAGQRAVDRLA